MKIKNNILTFVLAAGVVHFSLTVSLHANAPHLGYAFPAGGEQGSTFEAMVGGQYLEKENGVYVSGKGVKVSVIEYIEPEWKKKQKEKIALNADGSVSKKKTEEKPVLREGEKYDKYTEELMKKRKARKQKNVQIDDMVRLRVTIAKGAEPGDRELRLMNSDGVSNPLKFQVGTLPEMVASNGVDPFVVTNFLTSLPVLANGQILPGEKNLFSFTARKGQSLVIDVKARALMPYLADAVPGWFQPVISLFNSKGVQVAFVDDYQFYPDPVMIFNVPEDGAYFLEMRDSIYRGREDFVYRMSIGELPFIRYISPMGGRPGVETPVRLVGVNLRDETVRALFPSNGIYSIRARNGKWLSNDMPFMVDDIPDCGEREAKSDSKPGALVQIPVVVNGCISKQAEADAHHLQCKAGECLVVEVYARRLGSPLDSVITLAGPDGKVLMTNDDNVDPAYGLVTHHADSYLMHECATNGIYTVLIADAQGRGGEAFAYRVRFSAPQPDFAVRLSPSGLILPREGSANMNVHVIKKDGFKGPVKLELAGAPEGFSLNPAEISDSTNEYVRVSIRCPEKADLGLIPLSLNASSVVAGKTLVRKVVPAEDMMQAFLYRHLVPGIELMADVVKRRVGTLVVVLDAGNKLRIPQGGSVSLVIRTNNVKGFNGKLRLQLDEPPVGITMDEIIPAAGKMEVALSIHADDDLTKVGETGALVVSGRANAKIQCSTPVVQYEIVD